MSSHQFKPGDPVLVIGGPRRGSLAHVTSNQYRLESAALCTFIVAGDIVVDTDMPCEDHRVVVAKPSWLLPLLDDSKRAEYLQDLNLDVPSEEKT